MLLRNCPCRWSVWLVSEFHPGGWVGKEEDDLTSGFPKTLFCMIPGSEWYLGIQELTAGAYHTPSPPGQLPMPSGRNVVYTSHKVSLSPHSYYKACLFHFCSIFPPLHFSAPTHHLFITDDIVAGQMYGEGVFSLCKSTKTCAESPLWAWVCKKPSLLLLLFPFGILPYSKVYIHITQIFRTPSFQMQSMPVHFLYRE